ncbi:MAG TPA: ion channel [Candidatus Binataceae bacterium]|nr:ion channel [Candidatus Binataceae bacterium]
MALKKQSQLVPVTAGSTPLIAQMAEDDRYFSDVYHHLLTSSWPLLLLQISAAFFAANALFALVYLLDGGIENARPGSFSDVYFFSVETMATIGYGRLTPITLFAHIVMSIEALTGFIFLALVTGLIFAKFSRPTARVRFSHSAVVSRRDGVPSLMFRMANVRANQIVEAQVHVVFSRQEKTLEGEPVRRFYDLDLTRKNNAIFAYSWTVIHPIVENSPLYGASAEALAAANAWIVASVTGLDETFSQTVYARMYYGNANIRWGARMADIMVNLPDGSFALDFARFDEIEPVELQLDDADSAPDRAGARP